MSDEQCYAKSIYSLHYSENTTAEDFATQVCEMWRSIDLALSPVIGARGVSALINRTVHLQCPHHPVLKAIAASKTPDNDFLSFHELFSSQTTVNAALINNDILKTFIELLTILIGESLTYQLLHLIFIAPSSGDPAQDILP